jgi:hypothetical protein
VNRDGAGRVDAEDLRIQVVDLPGDIVGRAYGDMWIQLDVTAAGQGWFLDATPGDDAEFEAGGQGLTADLNSPAFGRMDALTVVMHELGHVYGYHDEFNSEDLMGAVLPTGTRRLPTAGDSGGVDDLPGSQVILSPADGERLKPHKRIAWQDANSDGPDAWIAALATNDDHSARTAAIDRLLSDEDEEHRSPDQKPGNDYLWNNDLFDDLLGI